MANVLQFPERDRVEVYSGTEAETGKQVYVFEMFSQGAACNIAMRYSEEEARTTAEELRAQGERVIWKP